MDESRFDRLTRTAGTPSSRRRLLGGLLAVAAASSIAGVAAKPGNGHGNGSGHGNAFGKHKVGICHGTDSGFQFKRVPTPALKGHVKHGDQQCPVDTDCIAYASCDQTTGACLPTVHAGDACVVADTGGAGTCDPTGACIANV
jgi:hypothetical protein